MRRIVTAIAGLAFVAIFASVLVPAVQADDAPPPDRVVVMYFHRTQRCPTCLKMGGYTEEAVKTGFAQELKERKVELHSIDFQDKKNEVLTKGYQVSGPTLIVARVVDNKVAARKNLKEMWAKAGSKDAFIAYVQSNVRKCQSSEPLEK